jgi:hypothetical protein
VVANSSVEGVINGLVFDASCMLIVVIDSNT